MTDFTTAEVEALRENASLNKLEDPSGEYPDPGYFFKDNTNTQALGEERNDLEFAATAEGVKYVQDREYVNSIPGLNQVDRSITGHVFEVDDTSGNERILIKHKDGAGIELSPDGSVLISALKQRIEVTGGDQNITIVGDAKMIYQGNLDVEVAGDYNIQCNELNVKVKNNKTETIGGAEKREIYKGITTTVVGDVTNYFTSDYTNTVLGKENNFVKGNVEYNIGGTVGFYSTGEMNVTSERYINMGSQNITISANDMSILGGSGVIGGTAVDFVGNGAIFDRGVTATVFTGNLKGTAEQTKSQTYGEAATTDGGTLTSDTPAMVTPTETLVNTLLTKSAGGIRKVKIDIGDYIKNFLDKSSRYDGLSSQQMDVKKARSKLRDPANRSNNVLVKSLIEEGTLCESFNNPTPPAIGRIVDEQSTSLQTKEKADAIRSVNNAVYIPKNSIKQFLPDPKYNPDKIHPDQFVTSTTKLSENISMAHFLGTDDPVNISHIRNREVGVDIARHLYLQTIIMNTIQSNKSEFKGVTLQVSEGLYKPGAGEKVTAGSINDLMSKGRAVAYKAVDSQGNINNSKLFDIAAYLKDNAYFDTMTLSYDTNECSDIGLPIIAARLIITMPELGPDYTGQFSRTIFTEFNSNRLSQGELVEVVARRTDPEALSTSNPNSEWVVFKAGLPASARNIDPALFNSLIKIAQEFGKPLVITEGFRPSNARRGAKKSQHKQGKAVDIRTNFSDQETIRLIDIAARNGIRGIGIYRTSTRGGNNEANSVHFDNRVGAKAAWGNDRSKGNYSRTELYRYPWAHPVLRKYGFPTG